jgi:hypothetical protein
MPSFGELEDLDLHLRFFIDTMIPDDPHPASIYLREMGGAHRIWLFLAVIGEEELNRSSEPRVRDLATRHIVALGIGVHEESRWGRSLWGSGAEQEELAGILAILTSEGARHLHTAYRSGGDRMFITRDGEHGGGILGKAEALRQEFDLRVMTPETAEAIVRRKAGVPPPS